MTVVLQVLVAVSILLTLGFVLTLGPPQRSENPPVAWMLAAWGWVTAAFEVLLLLALFRVHVPVWLAAWLLLVQDGVWIWRLTLILRTRRQVRAKG